MGENTQLALRLACCPTVDRVPHDRQLAGSPFPSDDGQAAPLVRERLQAASDGDQASYLRAVATLGAARLLVPVVAAVTSSAAVDGGLRVDKEAEMSVISWQTSDGRRCGMAFTGLDSLSAWHAEARPVPVTLDVLARSALDDGADAVIVDAAGPGPLVIERDLLDALAQGQRLVELEDGGFGWLSASRSE
jgi:hypothetical protein